MANVVFNLQVNSAQGVAAVQQFLGTMNQMGPSANTQSNQATSAFGRVEATIGKMKSAITGFIAAVAFAKVIQGFKQIVESGIEFEESFAGIRKTVEGTETQFEQLRMEIRQLAKEVPISVNELNKIGEIGGQLGIPTEQLRDFTETIAKIGIATNLSTDEAANGFARFNAIMDESALPVKTLAGVIVDLGNKFPATEQEILSFSLNIAGAAKQVGLSSQQVAALSTSLASVGLHSEKAGTAMSRIFIDMGQAVDKGGIKLQNFAAISGVTTSEFSRQFKEDAAKSLLLFLGGLNKMSESGQNATIALESVGLSEIRVRDVTLRAKEAIEVFAKALGVAEINAGNAGKALDVEVAKKSETASSQLRVVGQRLNDVAIAISNELVPSLVSGAKHLANFASGFVDGTGRLNGGLSAVIDAVKALVIVLGAAGLAGALRMFTVGATGFVASAAGILNSTLLLNIAYGGLVFAIFRVIDAWDMASAAEAEVTNNTSILSQKTSELQVKLDKPFAQGATQSLGEYNRETIAAFRAQIQHELAEVAATKALWGHAAAATGTGAVLNQLNGTTSKVTLTTEEHAKALKKAGEEAKEYAEFWDKALNTFRKESGSGGSADDQIAAGLKAGDENGKKIIEHYKAIRELQLELITMNRDYLQFWDEKLQEIKSKGMVSGGDDIEAGIKANDRIAKDIIEKAQDVKDAGKKIINDIANDISRMFIDSITHGKSFWESFKGLGLAAISSITDSFLKTMIHGFLDPFAAKFGGWAKSLSGVFGGLLGSLGGLLGIGSVGASASTAALGAGALGTGAATAGTSTAASIGAFATNPATIAVAGAIAATWAVIKSQAHHEANRFVKDFQNPFGSALSNIVDSFNAAAAAGTLSKDAAQAARDSVKDLWDEFVQQTMAFAEGGSDEATVAMQALATMTSHFGDNLSGLLGGMDATIATLKNTAAVAEHTNKVLKATDGWQDLEEAIQMLMDTGMDWAPILDLLGGDIDSMAAKMRLFGMTIPPAMQAIIDASEANKDFTKNVDRLKEVEQELADVRQRTADAIIRKMDFLDSQIQKSEGLIAKWSDEIKSLNDDISDAAKKLQDTKYWQKEYNNAIKETQDDLKRITDERKSIEERIQSIQIGMHRDQLERALEFARTTEDAVAISIAENALRAFENEQRILENDRRDKELQHLLQELPKVIQKQKEAEAAAKAAQEAAVLEIEARKKDLQDYIDAKIKERDALRDNILKEKERIDILKEDLRLTGLLLDIMGIKRDTELGVMNASISALIARGAQLEDERQRLSALTGVGAATVDIFGRLGTAFIAAANVANAAIASLGGHTSSIPAPTPAPPPNFPAPSQPATPPPTSGPAANLVDWFIQSGMGGLIGLPQFAHGTDRVPHDTLAMVHAGERIIPAWRNTGSDGGNVVSYSPSVTVNISGGMGGGDMKRVVRDQIIPEILSALDVNSSQIVRRIGNAVIPKSQPKLIIK